MSWGQGYRNTGIRVLGNYHEAAMHYANVKPIRGREKECRPLGHRNRPHFSIMKEPDGSIVCCDYNPSHKCVTFKGNGEVQITPHWVSVSTGKFIEEVLGVGCTQQNNALVLFLRSGQYRIPKDGITLKREDGIGTYEVVNAAPNVIHHIKRKEANNVRAKYVDITNYMSGYIKLMGIDNACPHALMKEVFGEKEVVMRYGEGQEYKYTQLDVPKFNTSKPEEVDAFFALAESGQDGLYRATLVLCQSTNSYRNSVEKLVKDVLQLVDRLILARHKHEVFKVVEVPQGQVKKDPYSWAFA